LRPRGWSDRDESGSVSRRDNRDRAPLEYRSKRASHPQRAEEVTPKTDKRKGDLAAPKKSAKSAKHSEDDTDDEENEEHDHEDITKENRNLIEDLKKKQREIRSKDVEISNLKNTKAAQAKELEVTKAKVIVHESEIVVLKKMKAKEGTVQIMRNL